ncbi:pyridoxal phosphate-dependent aminotransferase [Candidatus Peregrinibacteria bacterium]|nr:pyridoxal phosphate-dependent aminotransferase [Candidatus Peregrinibacteria bacterium]
MKLYDNKWGFSIEHNNPFRVFRLLQEVAKENMGADKMIDLSRGDPGYGFAPSVRGREFLAFLLFLDTKLNNPGRRFVETKKERENKILEEIASYARANYVPAVAERYLEDLSEFIQRTIQICGEQGLEMSPYAVLYEIFKYSTVSGGCYHDPQGEKMVRAITAWWHKKTIQVDFNYEDIIFTNGASHAIGTFFKLLGEEGIRYLTPGDKILILSPAYSPYNDIIEHRGLEAVSLPLDQITGEKLKSLKKIKAIVIIDPNNPTGISLSEEALQILAGFAAEQDAIVISDEVYSSFFPEKKTMMDFCPERTIRIQARSKIERSTGLRFGDVLITKPGNEYLTAKLKDFLPAGTDFKTAFVFAKGPTGAGELQHTTFVPGPSQYLGAAHILLGADERREYRELVKKNHQIFNKILGLKNKNNLYYVMFDMDSIKGANKQDVSPEEKLTELAKRGVIYIPANLFFSAEDRASASRVNSVRASLVNASPEKIKEAAQITLDYLT